MTSKNSNSKFLHISLWIAQVVLAAMFGMAGAMKMLTPVEKLVENGMVWAEGKPALAIFIGISELLGAIGVILPALLRIKPFLSPLAALGLFTVMVLALGYHIISGDTFAHMMPSVVLGLIAAFVAWGRYKKVPIQPKQ